MTSRDVTPRLVDSREESVEVRSLLEAGIDDGIGDYDFDRGLETHLAAVAALPSGGGGPAAPSGGAPGASSAAGGMSGKALALAIGIPAASLSAIAAVAFLVARGPSSAGAENRIAEARPSVVEVTNPVAGPGGAAGAEHASGLAADPATASERSVAAPSSSFATERVDSLRASRSGTLRPEKVALVEDSAHAARSTGDQAAASHSGIVRSFPEGPVAAAAPARATPTPEAARAAERPADRAVVAPDEPRPSQEELERAERAKEEARRATEDKLQREMDELMRAKRALSNDPKLALELAERGQREFKDSLLREEREHVLLLALIGVGRTAEAERRAAPYLAKHPDSPFARRVRAALDASKSGRAH